MVQMRADFSGAYLTDPAVTFMDYDDDYDFVSSLMLVHTLKSGVSASGGTGTKISTLLAVDFFLNCPLACKVSLIMTEDIKKEDKTGNLDGVLNTAVRVSLNI